MVRFSVELPNLHTIFKYFSTIFLTNVNFSKMETISWQDFEKVQIRAGTILEVRDFPKAKKPAYQLVVDLGEEVGIKQSSAQLTKLYSKEDLLGRQVICVTNFAPRQVANFISEILVTGFILPDGEVVLSTIERPVPNGTLLA
jgi:tRNA-binding protein